MIKVETRLEDRPLGRLLQFYQSSPQGWSGGCITDAAMSVERERTLAAEMLAVKTVMAHVLGRINQLDPVLAEAIQGGFEDAEDKIRKTMIKSRKSLTSDQGIKALAVIQAIRATTFSRTENRIRSSVTNNRDR